MTRKVVQDDPDEKMGRVVLDEMTWYNYEMVLARQVPEPIYTMPLDSSGKTLSVGITHIESKLPSPVWVFWNSFSIRDTKENIDPLFIIGFIVGGDTEPLHWSVSAVYDYIILVLELGHCWFDQT